MPRLQTFEKEVFDAADVEDEDLLGICNTIMPKQRLVIDTDPGCDDVQGLLLALSSNPDDVSLEIISVTYGNVSVKTCLQNVVSTFHVIEQERKWRQSQGLRDPFPLLDKQTPLVAVGAQGPLGGHEAKADYYHGIDGLGGVSDTHPQYTAPAEAWSHLFDPPPPTPPSNDPITIAAASATHSNPPTSQHLFHASTLPAPDEILKLLASAPIETITLIALGPLTNYAVAAAKDPVTFLRAKSLLVMGGAIDVPGNITPVGEFNVLADPIAAARLFALTSPRPGSTMPFSSLHPSSPPTDDAVTLSPYPEPRALGDRRLNLVLFPLDVTMTNMLRQHDFDIAANAMIEKGSPLADWVAAFTRAAFTRNAELQTTGEVETALHDPLVVWYALSSMDEGLGWEVHGKRDVRVETEGEWTRGMCVVDRRGRKVMVDRPGLGEREEVSADMGGWLSESRGNRVGVCVRSPGDGKALAGVLIERIFESEKI